MALQTARLPTIKTLSGYDFSFQPSLDRHRVLALAQLEFVERKQCVHLLGPPGTGKSHLAIALGVEAVRAGKSVYMATLAELVDRAARRRVEIRGACHWSPPHRPVTYPVIAPVCWPRWRNRFRCHSHRRP